MRAGRRVVHHPTRTSRRSNPPARNHLPDRGRRLAFSVVDTADTGYAATWQAPNGATLLTAVVGDYDADAATWSCQVTSAALTASPNANDVTVPATFCQASSIVPQPGVTSYSLDGEFLQDPNVMTGLSRFLFENDTEEAYFFLGLDGRPIRPRRSAVSVSSLATSVAPPART